MSTEIFVFGSNLAGRHGKGAALHARKHYGAIYGQGWGLQGRSYAIPTKDENLKPLSILTIGFFVGKFIQFAIKNPDLIFIVSPIGCGLAGFKPKDIAPWFSGCPENVILPDSFKEIINGK